MSQKQVLNVKTKGGTVVPIYYQGAISISRLKDMLDFIQSTENIRKAKEEHGEVSNGHFEFSCQK